MSPGVSRELGVPGQVGSTRGRIKSPRASQESRVLGRVGSQERELQLSRKLRFSACQGLWKIVGRFASRAVDCCANVDLLDVCATRLRQKMPPTLRE